MNALDVGKKLVALCREGKNHEAMESLYAPDIVSIEAMSPPGGSAESKGLAACFEKGKMWEAGHQIHSARTEGPFPNGDRFAVFFSYDVTQKASGRRFTMDEVGLYTVRDGKIVREEFFYSMG
jgi:ketosteroid isomerase-like protein